MDSVGSSGPEMVTRRPESPEHQLYRALQRFVESRNAELDLAGDLTVTIKGGNTLTVPLVMLADAP